MKTVIVTGAARGIGFATSQLFAAQGYQVAMVDRDADALAAAVDGTTDAKGFTCDVSDANAVRDMIAGVSDWSGRLDCLINNAGVADFGRIEDTDFGRWRRIMDTNLDGVFLCAHAALEALKRTRGSIVNVA